MLTLTEKKKLLKEIPFKTIILYEENNEYLNNWIEFTKENRVLGGAIRRGEDRYKFSKRSIVVFEKENGDFNIIHKKTLWHISKDNKIYTSKETINNIVYKKEKNQLWSLSTIIIPYTNSVFKNENVYIKPYLVEKIGTILNNFEGYTECVSYNYCFKNNLTNYKKYIALKYKNLTFKEAENLIFLKGEYHIKSIVNLYKDLSHLNRDLFLPNGNPYIRDLLNMSYQLQVPISFKWSERRIKEEHDRLSKIITQAMQSFTKLENLNLDPVYFELEKFLNENESDDKFNLLRTNIDLISEGVLKKHCVASYLNKVNNHNKNYSTAIFNYKEFTLEINRRNNKFILNQCRGYRNEDSSEELKSYIQSKLDSFVYLNNIQENTTETDTESYINLLEYGRF